MKIAFHLAHPAHFHLFKNAISHLINNNYNVFITYNEKDVLEELISKSSFKEYSYKIKAIKEVNNNLKLKIQFLQKNLGLFLFYLLKKPDIVLGTSIIITLVGRILRYKSIIFNEDDFDIIEKTADLGYPYATKILCPIVCRTGKFDNKCIKYNSYHELAYLHPNHFEPSKLVAQKYVDTNSNYSIVRFANLKAHHDKGVKGIDKELAIDIVNVLLNYGDVYISSERPLEKEFEKYRIAINPLDMHHVISYASFYIGDSQTMAAEAGVLGIPFVRYNDFVGRISYLKELEEKYNLGYGVKPSQRKELIKTIEEILKKDDRKNIFLKRREKMLLDKIDLSKFMIEFIEHYPPNN